MEKCKRKYGTDKKRSTQVQQIKLDHLEPIRAYEDVC